MVVVFVLTTTVECLQRVCKFEAELGVASVSHRGERGKKR